MVGGAGGEESMKVGRMGDAFRLGGAEEGGTHEGWKEGNVYRFGGAGGGESMKVGGGGG